MHSSPTTALRTLPILLMALALAACPPVRGDDDDSGRGGDRCGGTCELGVEGAQADCGIEGRTEPSAVSNAPGELTVEHPDHSDGCCPTFTLSAQADDDGDVITVDYSLTDDFCDCICRLALAYTLTDLPAGAWTLELPGGAELPVEVQ